jgi:hypothetical protein
LRFSALSLLASTLVVAAAEEVLLLLLEGLLNEVAQAKLGEGREEVGSPWRLAPQRRGLGLSVRGRSPIVVPLSW